MRRDELGILRFRFVRESEFDAIPEQNRDLYTRYVVFKDDSDEILYEYLYGQRIDHGVNEVDEVDGVDEVEVLNILNQFTYDKQEIELRDTNILDEAKRYTDEKHIENGENSNDSLNIINLDTGSKDKITLYVINGLLGYEIEEEE